jgi:hypothetical protein
MLKTYPRHILRTGYKLYHGTDCVGNFSSVRGPGWFAHRLKTADKWAGWTGWTGLIEGREQGIRRVITYEVIQPIELLDTNDPVRWKKLVKFLCKDEQAGLITIAEALREKNETGWYSTAEVMLCRPEKYLRYVGEQPAKTINPYGR